MMQPASVSVLKRCANLFGFNETRDKFLQKDKYFLGEDGFETTCQNSITFFYPKPPVQDLMPRINVYHPDDNEKEPEERRLIASFKTVVKCMKTDIFYFFLGGCLFLFQFPMSPPQVLPHSL